MTRFISSSGFLPPLIGTLLLTVALQGCATWTTATTARTLPKGTHELGPITEVYRNEFARNEKPSSATKNTVIGIAAAGRLGLTDQLDGGVRVGLLPLGFINSADLVLDLKWAVMQGTAGAIALDPAVGLGIASVPLAFSDEESAGGTEWRFAPNFRLPILLTWGSRETAFVGSLGPIALRNNAFTPPDNFDQGWHSDPWLFAMRFTAGMSFQVTRRVRLQPELVFAAPILEAHHMQLVGGGIALGLN